MRMNQMLAFPLSNPLIHIPWGQNEMELGFSMKDIRQQVILVHGPTAAVPALSANISSAVRTAPHSLS